MYGPCKRIWNHLTPGIECNHTDVQSFLPRDFLDALRDFADELAAVNSAPPILVDGVHHRLQVPRVRLEAQRARRDVAVHVVEL